MKTAILWLISIYLLQMAQAAPAIPAELQQSLIQAVDQQQALQPELIAATTSKQPEIRAAAVKALGQILKADSVDVLLNMVSDVSPLVEKELCFSLGQLAKFPAFSGNRRDLISEKLSLFLIHPTPLVLKTCTTAFGKSMSENNQNNLLYLFQNSNPEIIEALIYAVYQGVLAKTDRAPDQPAFVLSPEIKAAFQAAKYDQHANGRVRKAIGYIASTLNDEEGNRIAIELSKDTNPEVRTSAARSLARLQVAPEHLAALLADADDQVVTEALTGLNRKKAFHLVPETLLQHPSFHVRSLALNLIGQRTDIQVDFQAWLTDLSQTVRYEAAKALLQKQNPALETQAQNFLASPEIRIREALAEMAGNSASAEILLLKLLEDVDPSVQVAAIATASSLKSRQLFDAMKPLLASAMIRWAVIDALGNSDLDQSYPLLVDAYSTMLDDHSESDRQSLLNFFLQDKTARGTRTLWSTLEIEPSPRLYNRILLELIVRQESQVPQPKKEVLRSTPHIGRSFARNPTAIFQTVHGEIRMLLFADQAPIHVADLVGQIESGKYQGGLWHRVVSNFVIQSSNPNLTLQEMPDYLLRAEINDVKYERGSVGMPRSNDFDSGSGPGIFINHLATPHLDGDYTVIGKVTSALNVIDQIEVGDEILSAQIQY